MYYNMMWLVAVMYGVSSVKTPVIKHEGETVTLSINKIEQNINYLWTFGRHTPLTAITVVTNGKETRVNGTRFANRLNTDVETGSITISNLTINDSGIFLIQLLMETGIVKTSFNLSVHSNLITSKNVLEGNNVTMDTGAKKLYKQLRVKWMLGTDFDGVLIAGCSNNITFIHGNFTGVLQLNPHTGSLTIIRVTKKHAGFYCVKILSDENPYILRQYLVRVFEPVPTPHICFHSHSDGSCYITCCVDNTSECTLSWYRREKLINETSNPDISTNLSLPLEIQNEGSEDVYSCVAANPASNKTISVNSTQWCPHHGTDADPDIKWWIGVVVVAVVAAFAAFAAFAVIVLVKYLWPQNNNQGAENCFQMRNMQQETASQDTGVSTQDTGDSRGSNGQHLLGNG